MFGTPCDWSLFTHLVVVAPVTSMNDNAFQLVCVDANLPRQLLLRSPIQFCVSTRMEENLAYDAEVQALSKALKVFIVILHHLYRVRFLQVVRFVYLTSAKRIQHNKREENPTNNPIIRVAVQQLV